MQTNGDQQRPRAPARGPESLPRAGAASACQGAANSLLRAARQALWLILLSLILAAQAWAIPCDVDQDGDIDLDDLNLIQKAILARAKVSGPDDPRDADGNGVINSIDGRLCALRCTRAKCSTVNQAPFANAGPDQSVPLGSLIRLDGSASRDPEGATLSYAWLLIARPAGSHAALTGADSANPTFSADLPGQYLVQLIVNDGQLASTPNTVSISVTNTPPTVSLSAPAAKQSFTAPATITVSAEAADTTGNITEVAFYQGSTPIGSATSAPYRITWSNVPVGNYVLKARATDSGGATTWSAEVPIAVAAGGVKIYYLHQDHLNTPRMVTDDANRVVWRNTPLGEPFGMSLPEEDPDGDGQAFTLNLRFPGQYADRESNLNYNYFRDYDPVTGRYATFDAIGLKGGINGYAYVLGNPLRYADPLGLWSAEAHNYFIQQAFGNALSHAQVAQMQAGSAFADAPIFQTAQFSYMHAMSSSNISKDDARRLMCRYVKKQIDIFKRLITYPDPVARNHAYFELGMGLHAVMDSTSPAHRGFQLWTGSPAQLENHGKSYPGFPSTEDLDSAPAYLAQTIAAMVDAMNGKVDACECQ
ncbi:RHS repeat domain-containing protein [Candidatus Accumulibacter aalborgensis]|nr:RHS repeat-associated core domain-containing protein [Candidatus Accumulibacter aalborgensis]